MWILILTIFCRKEHSKLLITINILGWPVRKQGSLSVSDRYVRHRSHFGKIMPGGRGSVECYTNFCFLRVITIYFGKLRARVIQVGIGYKRCHWIDGAVC